VDGADATGALCMERMTSPPFGLRGGCAGAAAVVTLTTPDGVTRLLPGKGAFAVSAGSVIDIACRVGSDKPDYRMKQCGRAADVPNFEVSQPTRLSWDGTGRVMSRHSCFSTIKTRNAGKRWVSRTQRLG